MHFWINKPAGRYYGFGGRRYPATPLPKARSGQRRRGREAIRPMVTPVHRFHNLNGASHAPGPSNLCNNGPRHLRPAIRNVNTSRTNNNTENISLQVVAQQDNDGANNVNCQRTESRRNGELHSAQSTLETLPTRGLLDFSHFSNAELAVSGIWIMCVLAAGLVMATKFYFDHRGTGLDVLVFLVLLVTLLLSGCLYSILCRRTENSGSIGDAVLQAHEDPIAALTEANTIANENIGLPNTVIPATSQNPPPPPYHIAILIPPSHSADEIPPPSYDKVAVQ